jgi:hypothetical protein
MGNILPTTQKILNLPELVRVFENLGEIFPIDFKARIDLYKIAQMRGCIENIKNCTLSFGSVEKIPSSNG